MKSFLCRHFENLLGLVLVASHRSYTLLPSRGNFENNTLVYVINFFLLSGGHLGHNNNSACHEVISATISCAFKKQTPQGMSLSSFSLLPFSVNLRNKTGVYVMQSFSLLTSPEKFWVQHQSLGHEMLFVILCCHLVVILGIKPEYSSSSVGHYEYSPLPSGEQFLEQHLCLGHEMLLVILCCSLVDNLGNSTRVQVMKRYSLSSAVISCAFWE